MNRFAVYVIGAVVLVGVAASALQKAKNIGREECRTAALTATVVEHARERAVVTKTIKQEADIEHFYQGPLAALAVADSRCADVAADSDILVVLRKAAAGHRSAGPASDG